MNTKFNHRNQRQHLMSKRFGKQTRAHDRDNEEGDESHIRVNFMKFNGRNQRQTLMPEVTKNDEDDEEESVSLNKRFHDRTQVGVVMNNVFNYLNQGQGMINRRFSFQVQGNRRPGYQNQGEDMMHKRISEQNQGHDLANGRFNNENKGKYNVNGQEQEKGIKTRMKWFRDQGQKLIEKRFDDGNEEHNLMEMRYNDGNGDVEGIDKGLSNQSQVQGATRESIIEKKGKGKDVIGEAGMQPRSSKERMKTLLDYFSEEDGYGGRKREEDELLMMGESSEKNYIVDVISRVLERIVRRNDDEVLNHMNDSCMSNPNDDNCSSNMDDDDDGDETYWGERSRKDEGVVIRRLQSFNGRKGVPAISVSKYLERVSKYSGCSPCCFVLAYSYMDRLAHLYARYLAVTSLNVHRLFITSMLIAVKLLDDVHYNNAFYAKVGGISNTELNKLELNLLFCLDFKVHVNQHVFESYWSHLEMQCQTIAYEFTYENTATLDDQQEPIEDDL